MAHDKDFEEDRKVIEEYMKRSIAVASPKDDMDFLWAASDRWPEALKELEARTHMLKQALDYVYCSCEGERKACKPCQLKRKAQKFY